MTTGAESDLESHARGRLGTTLRRKYRLDAVIGVGGMAVVFKATHRNQAEFAVKMLHPELSLLEDVRTRFVREGYAANSVKHPGVVLVVDDDVAEDGAAFLVMELLDGAACESLWERHGGKMPVGAACAIIHQLLDVLTAAHAKGVIHRDLKPANLFVLADGRVKVLDFGIARVRDAAAGRATATGMLLGTPAFMGPEQALGKSSEIDAKTDLWAVGATLFTLISGSLVHHGDNGQQLMINAATQRARSLAEVAPHVAKEIVAVVDRALAFERSERWESAAAMAEALSKAWELSAGAPLSRSVLAGLVGKDPEPAAAPATAKRAASDAFTPTVLGPSETRPNELESSPTVLADSARGGSPALSGFEKPDTSTATATELPSLARSANKTSSAIVAAVALGMAATLGLLAVGKFGRGGTSPTTSPAAAASPPPPSAAPTPAEGASVAPTASTGARTAASSVPSPRMTAASTEALSAPAVRSTAPPRATAAPAAQRRVSPTVGPVAPPTPATAATDPLPAPPRMGVK
jgi:serine/threonine-protein kinase